MQINMAYGYYSQGISTALEEGLIGFLELYFPVNSSKRIETAHHYIGSLSWNPSPKTKMTITGYYKKFSGLLKSTGSSPLFAQTPGQAKGIEFELETSLFGFSGWCTYTWAHSNRTYNSITYDTNFDQRHRFQIFAKRSLKYDFLISGFWEFYTGQPYDPANYFALIPEIIFPRSSRSWKQIWYQGISTDVPRGRVRYPLYHRLDLKIMKIIQGKRFTFAPYISIRNVYNRANPLFYKRIEFDADFENDKIVNGRIKRDAYIISILPTVGFRFGF